MHYIPGGRLIKKYIYRFIGGLLMLPLAPTLLIWNEWLVVVEGQPPIFQEIPGIAWMIRGGGLLLSIYSVYLMVSGIKLFMSRIPLSYGEIRNGLRITSILIGGCISSLSMAIVWLLYHPVLGFIPLGVAISLLMVWMLRSIPRKKTATKTTSVKPHSAKDV